MVQALSSLMSISSSFFLFFFTMILSSSSSVTSFLASPGSININMKLNMNTHSSTHKNRITNGNSNSYMTPWIPSFSSSANRFPKMYRGQVQLWGKKNEDANRNNHMSQMENEGEKKRKLKAMVVGRNKRIDNTSTSQAKQTTASQVSRSKTNSSVLSSSSSSSSLASSSSPASSKAKDTNLKSKSTSKPKRSLKQDTTSTKSKTSKTITKNQNPKAVSTPSKIGAKSQSPIQRFTTYVNDFQSEVNFHDQHFYRDFLLNSKTSQNLQDFMYESRREADHEVDNSDDENGIRVTSSTSRSRRSGGASTTGRGNTDGKSSSSSSSSSSHERKTGGGNFDFQINSVDMNINYKNIPYTLEQLLIVKTIVITGSFSAAADVLYMSQPSITISMKNLEKKLNKKIFERVNKELRLTFFGQLFLCYTDRILFLCDELSKVMSGDNFYDDFNNNNLPSSTTTNPNNNNNNNNNMNDNNMDNGNMNNMNRNINKNMNMNDNRNTNGNSMTMDANSINRIIPSLTLKSFLDDKRKGLDPTGQGLIIENHQYGQREKGGEGRGGKLPLFYTSATTQRNTYTLPSFMKQYRYQSNLYTPNFSMSSMSPYTSVNYLLKKVSKLIQLKKQYNLVSYSIEDLTIFTKREYEFVLLSSIKNNRNLSKLDVISLTDNMMLLRQSINFYQNKNLYKLMYSSTVEVNSMKALQYCLEANIGSTFFVSTSIFNVIKNQRMFH